MYLNKIKLNYVFYAALTLISLLTLIYIIRVPDSMIFPPTLVINLDSRVDRLNYVNKEFATWPVSVERISAVKYKPGWKGCSASHLNCIKLAKERNYPWVLIVEDDCILSSNALQQFQSLLPYLWNNRDRWDIFYGGITSLKHKSRVEYSPPIYEVSGYTTHFCLIHKSTYDSILNGHNKNILEYNEPIDVYYAENFRIWTTTPFFAKQRHGKSDIHIGKKKDSTYLFDKAEKELLML